MDEIVRGVAEAYCRIDPRDRRDTEAHMCQETLDHLVKSVGATIDSGMALIMNTTLLGLTVRIDDALPFGQVEWVTEDEQDRAIRRAMRDGVAVNIMKLEMLPPEVVVRETPQTLRGLLRKWLRRG